MFNYDPPKETADDITILFDGNISGTTYESQKIICYNIFNEAHVPAQKHMEHLELNGIDKGYTTKY